MHTVRALEEARARLPFADESDFEEWERGFIAAPPEMRIMADAGNVAVDMERFRFLDAGAPFDSVHPSLQRIGRLNNNYGLYEVAPGVYQTRGMDLANMTFVRGQTGWIVVDPVTTTETARASWELLQAHVGEGPRTGDRAGALRGRHRRADPGVTGRSAPSRRPATFSASTPIFGGPHRCPLSAPCS